MPRDFSKKTDPFDALPPEFKDAIASSTSEQIKARIALVFRDETENQRNLREDLNVQESKVAYDRLAAPYKRRKETATLNANVASKLDDHQDATDAALELDQIEQDLLLDNDLISAKETLKDAKAVYTEGTKLNDLKIKYCLRVLKDKGGA